MPASLLVSRCNRARELASQGRPYVPWLVCRTECGAPGGKPFSTIIGDKMAAVRAVVPRFLLFAAASSARTVSTHAGAVCRPRVYSLFSHSRVAHWHKEASPFLSSYGHRELSSISEEGRRWDDVHLKEFQTLLKEVDTYIIDVREPWELEQYGKFPESVNIPCRSAPIVSLIRHCSHSLVFCVVLCMCCCSSAVCSG